VVRSCILDHKKTKDYAGHVQHKQRKEGLNIVALVSRGFWATFTLVDSTGKKTTKEYHLRSANIATAVTNAVSIRDRLSIVSTAKIENYQVEQRFAEDAFTLPASGFMEEYAAISAPIAGQPGKRGSINVPSPHGLMFQSTVGSRRNDVDFGWTYTDLYLKMFDQPNGFCYVSDGEIIALNDLRGERRRRKTMKK